MNGSNLGPAPPSPPSASTSMSEQYDVEVKVEDASVSLVAEIAAPLSPACSVPSPAMYDRRVNRVSGRQLEILWEFLNSNRSIATAHNRSLQEKEYSRRKWKKIAEILNSQEDGAHKDRAGWTKYWVDYKAKLKKRVGLLRASHVQTGGEPSTERPFIEIEEKFLKLLGENIGLGTPGVQVELGRKHLPEISAVLLDVDLQDSLASESIPQNPTVLIPTQHQPSAPTLEPLAQNPPLEQLMIQDPLAHSPASPSPRLVTTSAARSPRHRRRRREPPMSQETARRALVRSTQMHAEAAVRIAEAMEKMVQETAAIRNTATRIERILNAAIPKAAEQENHE